MGMHGYLNRVSPARLDELLLSPMDIFDELSLSRKEKGYCTVEKTWNAIEFALDRLAESGQCAELSPINGSRDTGCEGSYGPVTYLTPDEVREIAHELSSITREMFEAVLNPDALTEAHVYPSLWEDETKESVIEYVWPYFDWMRECYRDACEAGDAMLLRLA